MRFSNYRDMNTIGSKEVDIRATSLTHFLIWLAIHGYLNTKGYFKEEKDSFDHWNNAPTILLSHGLTCTPSTLSTLGDLLKEKYNVAYAPKFPALNTASAKVSAHMLEMKILELLKNEPNGDLNLIGHSFWGLLSIEAVRISTEIVVNKIITMATPHKGCPGATAFKNIFPACKDMSEPYGFHADTELWEKLQGELIAYISEKDSVVPSYSQIPSRTIAPWRTRVRIFGDLDHWDFIMWEAVRHVAAIIKQDI